MQISVRHAAAVFDWNENDLQTLEPPRRRGAGEHSEPREILLFCAFKKEKPENLEECLCEVAGVLQGQLHRCQVCCTYFLQIPAAKGGGGGGGGAQR